MGLDKDKRIVTVNGAQYRLVRVIDKTETDIHHILSKKKRHEFNVDNPKNKIRLSRRKHAALNGFYGDHQTPKEQLKDMYDIWQTALSEEVRRVLFELLNLDDEAFYDYDIVKRHKILKDKIG